MLNDYHLQFLHHLTGHRVRFLIIGGQARHVHDGSQTRDLDLWVDIEQGSIPALQEALVQWSKLYPAHQHFPLAPPLKFVAGKQLKFPDAECLYMRRAGSELLPIGPADGIDILTSVEHHRFDDFYRRAFNLRADEIDLPFLSKEDLSVISPPR